MKEEEVHAIWAGLKIDRTNLQTTQGQAIKIIQIGKYNLDQGPDFLEAKIAIGKMVHEGHVEIHVDGDDWYRHKHHQDPNYDPVILHVVMRKSKGPILRSDGTEIPELVIGKSLKTPKEAGKMQKRLPCAGLGSRHIPGLRDWLEELAAARLELKLSKLEARLNFLKWDWQQLIWEELCRNFGGPVNGDAFWAMSQVASWRVMRKYQFKLEALEALLLGVAGLLEGRPLDAAQAMLKVEWEFLKEKHQLRPMHANLKQHRMRPASMPLARIKMLAAIVRVHSPLVQFLEPGAMMLWMETPILHSAGEDKTGPGLGIAQKQSAMGNVFLPISQIYHTKQGKEGFGYLWKTGLKQVPAEDNKKIRMYRDLGIQARNGLESQGLLHLNQAFCKQLKCLQCPIGQQSLGKRLLARDSDYSGMCQVA